MTTIKVFVRNLEPDRARSPISIQRPRLVGSPEYDADRDHEQTLAERVFLFLDQRSA